MITIRCDDERYKQLIINVLWSFRRLACRTEREVIEDLITALEKDDKVTRIEERAKEMGVRLDVQQS